MTAFFHRLTLCSTLLSLSCLAATAQDRYTIDSLGKQLPGAQGKARIAILNNLAEQHVGLFYIDSVKAMGYAKQAETLARTLTDSYGEAKSLYIVGDVYRFNRHKTEARKYYEQALHKAETSHDSSNQALALLGLARLETGYDKLLLAVQHAAKFAPADPRVNIRVTLRLGATYEALGQYPEALEYAHKVLKLALTLGDREWQAQALNLIGFVYADVARREEAIGYYKKALTLAKAIGDEVTQALILSNTGFQYSLLEQYREALQYTNQSVELAFKTHNQRTLGLALNTMGHIYTAQKKYEESLKYLNQAMGEADSLKDYRMLSNVQNNLAELYLATRHPLLALHAAEATVKLAQQRKQPDVLRDAALLQAKAAATLELYPEAYRAQLLYQIISDSMNVEAFKKKLAVKESEAALAREQLKSKLQEKTLEQKTVQTYGLAAVLGLVILLLLVLLWAYQSKVKANRKLAMQKEELEQTLQELKETHGQMLLNAKMAAIGHLVDGVAHEMNTPLGVIKATSQNLINLLPEISVRYGAWLASLRPANVWQVNETLSWALKARMEYSTREERANRREMQQLLTPELGRDADEVARKLVEFGLAGEQHLAYIRPLLGQPFSKAFIDYLHKMGRTETMLATLANATGKTERIVFTLLNYGKLQRMTLPETVAVSETLHKTLVLHASQFRRNISLIKEFDKVPDIKANPEELMQVWNHLIVNAMQAMDYSGTLTVSLTEMANRVRVDIGDTGPGIPREFESEVFTPFFSTKGRGEGAGLGLDICQRIVKKHAGTLTFITSDRGTTFTVTLPTDLEHFIQPELTRG